LELGILAYHDKVQLLDKGHKSDTNIILVMPCFKLEFLTNGIAVVLFIIFHIIVNDICFIYSVRASMRKASSSQKRPSPSKVGTYSSAKYKSPRMCRRLSLTSIDSNSSMSSTSTVSSYGSAQTDV
jgi:hypothetical protein